MIKVIRYKTGRNWDVCGSLCGTLQQVAKCSACICESRTMQTITLAELTKRQQKQRNESFEYRKI